MTFMERQRDLCPIICLLLVLAVMAWSFVNPRETLTWYLEAIPAIATVILLWATYRHFRFTDFLYVLITLQSVMMLVGAHYTYAEVPLFNTLRDHYELSRNHYDRVGHFVQGVVPALILRELLIRTSSLNRGFWMVTLIILACTGMSALYEIIEWAAAEILQDGATSFLGTQGDVWDSHKDMALAFMGSILSLAILSGAHDRYLKRIA